MKLHPIRASKHHSATYNSDTRYNAPFIKGYEYYILSKGAESAHRRPRLNAALT